MNVQQHFSKREEGYQNDVLFAALKEIIPDFSYPADFYSELQRFLFTNDFSFFDEMHRPPLLVLTLEQLAVEDQDNLLTVLEGAKALILEHGLFNMSAYNSFMTEAKTNRFLTRKIKD